MALNKLRCFDNSSAGVTIPRDDLRLDGLVDETGEIKGEHVAHIRRDGPREYSLTILPKGGV